MKYLFVFIFASILSTMTLFDFNPEIDISKWQIVDDVVMGGRSNGNFNLDQNGHGEFSGFISLKNNGGFSSVRYRMPKLNVENFTKAILRIKGDGKNYQFRIKSNSREYATYVYEFETTEEWSTIEVPFEKMRPQFRGRKLNMPNYPGETIEEITFLIGNKKEESFKLLIDSIKLN
ncbi:MAG: CIA30 family protein [Bacteroidota bacterium]